MEGQIFVSALFFFAQETELSEEMLKSLEVYFEVCEEQGKVPNTELFIVKPKNKRHLHPPVGSVS